MSFFDIRNAIAIGVSQHTMLGSGPLLTRLSPSLLLQFAGAETLDPRITFTRTTTATRTNANGLIESVAINAPRFDYDPVTLQPDGLLIEEQRTNLLTYSEQFDNAAWNKFNASVTGNADLAPDGTVTADKLVENTVNSQHAVLRASAVSITANTTHTFSAYLKDAGRGFALIMLSNPGFTSNVSGFVNLSTGAITNVANTGTATGATVTAKSVGNGWWRVRVSGIVDATSTTANCAIYTSNSPTNSSYPGDGTSGIYVWGAQLEAGALATSYIPTTTAARMRSEDVAVITGTNFSSWYNASAGTFYVEALSGDWSSDGNLLSVSDGTNSNRIQFGTGGGNIVWNPFVVTGGAVQATLTQSASYSPKTSAKQAMVYRVNDFAATSGGAVPALDTSGNVPTVNQIILGSTGSLGVNWNSHIRCIAYYPRRLSNAELQAITE